MIMKIINNYFCKRFRQPYLIITFGKITQQTQPVIKNTFALAPLRKVKTMITLGDNQQTVLTVSGKDKKGNDAKPEPSALSYFVDNTDLLSITKNDDGSALLKAVGPLGNATVSVKATLADGTEVSGSDGVTVISEAATQLVINGGTPTEQ